MPLKMTFWRGLIVSFNNRSFTAMTSPARLVERSRSPFCFILCFILFLILPLPGHSADAPAAGSIPGGLELGEWQSIQQQIRAAEYHPAITESGDYAASNRAQGLHARFGRDGRVQVTPAAAQSGLSLRLTAYGYGDALHSVPPAEKPAVKGNRVEYRRGDLTEWYVNDARGIEQGFTLDKPPVFLQKTSSQNKPPLRLALTLDGVLTPELNADAQTAVFKNADGRTVFRYEKLHVTDARGQIIAAHFELPAATTADRRDKRAQLHILAEDAGAVYPLVIDPLITAEKGKFNRVYADVDDGFGGALALDGDVLLASAYGDESCTLDAASSCPVGGAVYVFVFNGTAWNWQTKLTASDAASGDWFGSFVALSGDTAFIGAAKNNNSGSVYVFTRSDTAWSQQAKLTAGDVEAGYFGVSGALIGDTALIGSYGSAYVFTRNGMTWSQQAKLTADDAGRDDWFGWSVALSGDTALIGANTANNGGSNFGSTYVFTRNGTVWSQQAKLIADEAVGSFGHSVALDGDTALIGAYGTGFYSGSAYVFMRSGTVWSQHAKLTADDTAKGKQFGRSVTLNGNTALIGAMGNTGSVYVFTRNGTIWSQQAKLTVDNGKSFGHSVALSGDIALIHLHVDDYDSISGSVYVFTRSSTAWSQQQKLTADDTAANQFGWSVSLSDDTALIGAPYDGGDSFRFGSAYVLTRNGTNWNQQQKLIASDAVAGDRFGWSVSLSGDTALISAYWDDGGLNGSAYIFTRNGTVWSQQAKLTTNDTTMEFSNSVALMEFGNSVALSGDTALIGSDYNDGDGRGYLSAVYVFTRNGTVWSQQARLTSDDTKRSDFFGKSVALSGNTAFIGASHSGNGDGSGSVYVFTRNGTVWSQQAKLIANDVVWGDHFGGSMTLSDNIALIGGSHSAYVFTRSGTVWSQQAKLIVDGVSSVALSGDTVLIGAHDDGSNRSGSAYVFMCNGTIWTQQVKLTARDAAAYDHFGWSVALGDDVAFIGIPGDDDGGFDSGSVYVFDMAFVNNAPMLDNSGDMQLHALNENSPEDNPGTSITDLIASATGDRITDTDTGTTFGYEGIAVTAADTTGNGIWKYSLNDGADWTNLETPAETSARLLAADGITLIRFAPNNVNVADFNTAWLQAENKPLPSISFRAWDQTNTCTFPNANPAACKSNGDTDDVSVNGGVAPYSADVETATVTVNPVSDPPALAPIGNQVVIQGQTGSLQATVTDLRDEPVPNTMAYSLVSESALPWITIDSANGLINIAPNSTVAPGEYFFTVSVSESDDDSLQHHSVSEEISMFLLPSLPAQIIPLDQPFTLDFSGGNNDAGLTFSLGADEPGSIDADTGVYAWTPGSAGAHTLNITVTEAGGASVTQTVNIEAADWVLKLNPPVTSYYTDAGSMQIPKFNGDGIYRNTDLDRVEVALQQTDGNFASVSDGRFVSFTLAPVEANPENIPAAAWTPALLTSTLTAFSAAAASIEWTLENAAEGLALELDAKKSYKVWARAADSANHAGMPAGTEFTYIGSQEDTELFMLLSAVSLPNEEEDLLGLRAEGKLNQFSGKVIDLSALSVTLHIVPLADVVIADFACAAPACETAAGELLLHSAMSETGEYSFNSGTGFPLLNQEGAYQLYTSFSGTPRLLAAESERHILQVESDYQVYTELFMQPSAASLLNKEEDLLALRIEGKLNQFSGEAIDLSGLPVTLHIVLPADAVIADFACQAADCETAGNELLAHGVVSETGEYNFYADSSAGFPLLDQEGAYAFYTSFAGAQDLLAAESEHQTLLMGASAGYVLLIHGKTNDNEGLKAHHKTAERIYRRLRRRGFADESIEYLSYLPSKRVDGIPGKLEAEIALARLYAKMKDVPAPLYIIMIDHGNAASGFYMGDEFITPADVDGWLDAWEGNLAADNPAALDKPRFLMAGACYSGQFMQVAAPGRIIVTSAAADEVSYRGPKEPDGVRGGELFMEEFFQHLGRGKSFSRAFNKAVKTTENATRSGDAANGVNPVYNDSALQHPLLDDNGDGRGSNRLFPNGDGAAVRNLFLGAVPPSSTNYGGEPARILNVTETRFLAPGESDTSLWAEVNDTGRVNLALADVRPPGTELSQVTQLKSIQQDITGLIRLPRLECGYDRFCRLNTADSVKPHPFDVPGMYEVFYFALDNETGERSAMMRSLVYKQAEGNLPPYPVELLKPVNSTEWNETAMLLDWRSTDLEGGAIVPAPDRRNLDQSGPDSPATPITYTALISTSGTFDLSEPAGVVFMADGLKSAMAVVPKGVLENDKTYYWKVYAIDAYGGFSASEVFSFTTNFINAAVNAASFAFIAAMDYGFLSGGSMDIRDSGGNAVTPVASGIEGGIHTLLLPEGDYRAELQGPSGWGAAQTDFYVGPAAPVYQEIAVPSVGPGILQFKNGLMAMEEAETRFPIAVTRIGGSLGAVSANYTVTPDNAAPGADYDAVDGVLTWPHTDITAKTIPVTLHDDALYEGEEGFTVTLSAPTSGAILGGRSAVRVAIVDNEPPLPGTLGFAESIYSVTEGGTVSIAVNRTDGYSGAVSVAYMRSATGSTADSGDFSISGVLEWADGDHAEKILTLDIIDDTVAEGDETLVLEFQNPTGGAGLTAARTDVWIADNDAPLEIQAEDAIAQPGVLRFTQTLYAVQEDGGHVTVGVAREDGTAGIVSVAYAVRGNSAAAGSDYTPVGGILTWADKDIGIKTFEVPVVNDEIAEQDEIFMVTLADAGGGAASGGLAVVRIADDEEAVQVDLPSGSLQFLRVLYSIEEAGNSAVISVTRENGTAGAVSAAFAVGHAGDTAAADEDYISVQGVLFWDDEDAEAKTFAVPIVDDDTAEEVELLTLTLSDAEGGAVLGNIRQAVLSIADADETGSLQFLDYKHQVSEDAGTADIPVSRTGGTEGEVSADYAFEDSGAERNTDYAANEGTLTWADGDGEDKTISVDIPANESADGNRSFIVTLSNPGGGVVLGLNAITVTVIDDDAECPAEGTADTKCNALGKTLARLTVTETGHVSNGALAGTIESAGEVSNLMLLTNASLTGGTVSGYITGISTAVVRDIHLRNGASLSGFKLAGAVTGDGKGLLENLVVMSGAHLSNLVIGDRVHLQENVTLGENVRFSNPDAIPEDLELLGLLPELAGASGCADKVTGIIRRSLIADVTANGPGLLPDINALLLLRDNVLEQDPEYGYLHITLADGTRAAQQIVSVKRVSEAPPGAETPGRERANFILDRGLKLFGQPPLQAPCAFQAILAEAGLSEFAILSNGNLRVPIEDGFWASIRPDWVSVPAENGNAPGLFITDSPYFGDLASVRHVFAYAGGLHEQLLYPAPAYPKYFPENADFKPHGWVSFELDGLAYEGAIYYYVARGEGEPPLRLRVEPAGDVNEDGMADFTLVYPTGEEQTLYGLPGEAE